MWISQQSLAATGAIYPLTQKTYVHPLAVSIDQIPNQKLPFTL
uniref:Uncharacterized protein n=1 Tax=Moniliophthora roreri TaxID=221103 RepID=A0A0W0FQH8_MONRR